MSNEVKCMFMFILNLSLISELFQYAFTIALKVSLLVKKKKEFFSVHGKCRHFSMRLLLRTQGKLVLANFRLKIRPV